MPITTAPTAFPKFPVGDPFGRRNPATRRLLVAKDSLHVFLVRFEDALLVHTTSLLTSSERQRMVKPRKAYPIYPGLIPTCKFTIADPTRCLTRRRGLSYICLTMSILTVRISDEEKAALARRAKAEGITTGALVRRMIQQKPLTTAADLLAEIEGCMGDKRLAIKKRA